MKKYTQEELSEILRLHKLWIEDDPKGRRADLQSAKLQMADLQRADLRGADLRGADLRGADLQRADLREADLRRADLQRADLRWANLDFSCWPLWCGSKNVKLDKKLQAQLLGHIIDACKDVEFSKDQLDFVYENWERAVLFLGERVK